MRSNMNRKQEALVPPPPPPPDDNDDLPPPPPPAGDDNDIAPPLPSRSNEDEVPPPPPSVDSFGPPPPPVDDIDLPPPPPDDSQSKKTGSARRLSMPPLNTALELAPPPPDSDILPPPPSQPQRTKSAVTRGSAPAARGSKPVRRVAPRSTGSCSSSVAVPPPPLEGVPPPPPVSSSSLARSSLTSQHSDPSTPVSGKGIPPPPAPQNSGSPRTRDDADLKVLRSQKTTTMSPGSPLVKKRNSPSVGKAPARTLDTVERRREGFLTVKVGSGRAKKRYIVVSPCELLVFKDEHDSHAAELALDLQFAMVRPRPHDSGSKHVFELVTTAQTVSMQASDETELTEWISHLQQAIERLVLESADKLADGATQASASKQDDDSTTARKRARLRELMMRPENRVCCDCQRVDPQWASINIGSFICITCSGIHRGLGVHISKVRSATMDTWTDEQIDFIASKGNRVVNAYYEATLPKFFVKPHADTPIEEQKRFIVDKYVNRLYIPEEDKGAPPPPLPDMPPQSNQSSGQLTHISSGQVLLQHTPQKAAFAELARAAFSPENEELLKDAIARALESDPKFRARLKALLLQ